MFHPLLIALTLLVSIGVTASRAETQAEQNACQIDAQKFCGQFIPDRERVVQCLVRHRGSLNRICRTAIERDVIGGRGRR